ncbi:hypothetical protein [Scytonema sp. PCC 10023]|uniref:hypothetical protein n=1 Tax=Scytonema sp. PCC 10023 TaxID=1680591 RepID=UPI0039C5AE25
MFQTKAPSFADRGALFCLFYHVTGISQRNLEGDRPRGSAVGDRIYRQVTWAI